MQNYLDLLRYIVGNGTYKKGAREGMPGTYSIFGEQLRYDLSEGFPLVTTKKIDFKNIVVELLWFLRGDTNIKFLVDNGCNIWNEDAYRFFCKKCSKRGIMPFMYETFVDNIREGKLDTSIKIPDYKLGDCGKQYGWLWRNWEYIDKEGFLNTDNDPDPLVGGHGLFYKTDELDQIKNLIEGLKTNPESRRHIISAWNPATLNEMALPACHSFVQFNCRPFVRWERYEVLLKNYSEKDLQEKYKNESRANWLGFKKFKLEDANYICDLENIPKHKLDCKFTMRSSDAFLGLPYNIASYALLVHILSEICNMVPGDLITDLGDVHVYENHLEAVNEQLTRTPRELPRLKINQDWIVMVKKGPDFDRIIHETDIEDFILENYNPHPRIKAKLSTGLR